MQDPKSKPIGYQWLVERFGVRKMPYWKESRVLEKGGRRIVERDGRVIEYRPAVQDPGDEVFAIIESPMPSVSS